MAAAAKVPDLNKKLQEELTCSLCLDIFVNPVLIPKCSHNFCKNCISQHCQQTRTKASCPECRREFRPNGLIDNRSLANIVDIFHQMKKPQRTLARKPEVCWEQLDPSWTEDKKPNGSGGLLYVLKDVMKISELPQQIEATLKAINSLQKEDVEMKECVAQIKSSVAESFGFLKNYINDQEKTVLNVIDKGYRAARQKRDLIDDQLKARNEQLLELQTNSEELIKNTSLEQEVCIGDPVEMADVALAVQKFNSFAYVVEEFRRQLEKSVLWSYSVQLPQASTSEKCESHEIQMEVAEGEMASSSISTQSQESSQEASSCSSAMSSLSDVDDLIAGPSASGASLGCLQCEGKRSRSVIEKAGSVISSHFSQWASNITFDLKTLNERLELSEDEKKVSVSHFPMDYTHSARRFSISQVLGCQGFSAGCHYWEVITEGATGWAVGIAYEGIGNWDKLGRNELSWCVEWSNGCLLAWHRDQETPISNKKLPQVGVFLDIPGNRLSFYSPTDQETSLHEFEICVASPVYPAFWIFGMNAGESLTINDIRKS